MFNVYVTTCDQQWLKRKPEISWGGTNSTFEGDTLEKSYIPIFPKIFVTCHPCPLPALVTKRIL